jgi:hypothetical protein
VLDKVSSSSLGRFAATLIVAKIVRNIVPVVALLVHLIQLAVPSDRRAKAVCRVTIRRRVGFAARIIGQGKNADCRRPGVGIDVGVTLPGGAGIRIEIWRRLGFLVRRLGILGRDIHRTSIDRDGADSSFCDRISAMYQTEWA